MTARTDLGLLLLRIVLGVTFIMHGIDKLGDLGGTQQGFEQMGIPAASFMAPLSALTETIGGGLLIAGLLTPIAGFALTINMVVAGIAAHTGKGFFAQDGGYEYVLILGVASWVLAVAGAGRLSADALALRGRDRPRWARHMRTIAQQ
jgi:putative oxidoreductase